MDQARWDRTEDLLQRVLDLEADRRAVFLSEACAGDDGLRREVELLLEKEEEARSFMESPAVARFATGIVGPAASLVGRRISHYQVESLAGEGGMGEVYKARDENLQRTVALKVLPAAFTSDSGRVRRFEQEALAASRLNHPNIITIFEIIHTSDAHLIAAEYVEGRTLRELLTNPETKRNQRFDLKKTIDIAVQVVSALEAAHRARIIHRDVKPENVMVRTDGLVKLLDFGIAKLGAGERENGKGEEEESGCDEALKSPETFSPSSSTVPGTVMGTASYMSPEQACGEALDGRTDLFSLGVVLYEMAAGERLIGVSSQMALLDQVRSNEQPLPSDARFDLIPEGLQRIVRRLLRRNRDERYASAAELLSDLNRLKRRIENRTARTIAGLSVLGLVAAATLAALAAFLSVSDVWEERVLRDGHTAAARQAVFSPDGKLLVSVGEDNRVIVWDFLRRERLISLDAHTSEVISVAFAPDGQRFATMSRDGWLIVWDAARREQVSAWRESQDEPNGLSFSPDGKFLIAGGSDSSGSRVLARETQTWQPAGELRGIWGRNLPFFPNTRHAMDAYGTVWDVATSQRLAKGLFEGENWIAIAPNAATIATVNSDGQVSFYQLTRPGDARQPRLLHRERAHHDHGRTIEFSPDGQLVASGAEHIVLWDAATQKRLAVLEHSSIVWSVTFSPDGRFLASTHGDGAILLWNMSERARAGSLNEHSNSVRAVAFAPDGKSIATGSEDRSIILWNAETARKKAVLLNHETRVNGVAFSKDGQWIASSDQGGTVILWNATLLQPEWKAEATDKRGTCVAISPNSSWVATASGVYQRSTGHLVLDLRPKVNTWAQVYGVAFSGDGRRLACVTDNGNILIWDTQQWQLLHRKNAGITPQISVAFSPDGQWLFTGDDGGSVRQWRVEPLEQVAIIGRHDARIKSVACAPDGKTVASASDDKTIALWSVSRRKLVAHLGTHTAPVYAIAFSPDGKRLVSGGHDHSVRVFTRRRTLWGLSLD